MSSEGKTELLARMSSLSRVRGAMAEREPHVDVSHLRPLPVPDLPAGEAPAGREPVTAMLAGVAQLSAQTYAGCLIRLCERYGWPPPDRCAWWDLTAAHLKAIQRDLLHGGLAPTSVNKYLSAIRAVLRTAWQLELMDGEQLRRVLDVPSLKHETLPRGRHVEAWEIHRLFETIAADQYPSRGARDAAIFALLFGCGLRSMELRGVARTAYRARDGRLIVAGKGRKERLVFVPPTGRPHLDRWLSHRDRQLGREHGALVVPMRCSRCQDRTLTASSVWRLVRRRAADAGLSPFTPHDARRTWIGELLRRGADLATVQRLAGHASPRQTSAYDRRPTEDLRQASSLFVLPEGDRDDA